MISATQTRGLIGEILSMTNSQTAAGTTIRVVMDVQITDAQKFNEAAKHAAEINGLELGVMPDNPLYEVLANATDNGDALGIALVDYASFIVPDERESVTLAVIRRLGIPFESIIGEIKRRRSKAAK